MTSGSGSITSVSSERQARAPGPEGRALLPPIFVVGCPRSGTSLVARILDSHSRVAVFHETHYYVFFRPDLHRYGDLRRAGNLRRLIDDFRAALRVCCSESPPGLDEIHRALPEPTFEGVFAAFLHLHALRSGKVRGGDKTPDHYSYLPEILEGFPCSPVIFVLRDPRDTVASMRKLHGSTTVGAALKWREAFASYERHAQRVHRVRYEDLVRSPADTVEKMCEYIGEPFEPRMLRFFERVPDRLRGPGSAKLAEPVTSSSVGSFRQMRTRDIERIEALCADAMETLGYPLTTSGRSRAALKTPGPWARFLIQALGRARYYGARPDRWRRGLFRWRTVLGVRARHALRLGRLGRADR